MKCEWHRGGCDYPAMYCVCGAYVCDRCLREFAPAEQREATLIPQCDGIDADTGDPCPERTYERLCDHCREVTGLVALHDSVNALRESRHALTTLNGLYATDTFDAYGKALDDGVDPDKAHNIFVDQMWRINEEATMAVLDAALAMLFKALGEDVVQS